MPQLQTDQAIDDLVMSVVNTGQAAALAGATDFAWDQVALFYEGTPLEYTEGLVGKTGLKDRFYASSPSLLVFLAGGETVHLAMVGPDRLRGPFGVLLGAGTVVTPNPLWPQVALLDDPAAQ
ncbi:MAG: hypothetical protein LBR19_01495 [Bifidobacteriaceae bacterium]|jgi:hypothetical protein|nr:hypothetical protein [Bifidobacteriaceae bacterium]